jgi:hypothetical protein
MACAAPLLTAERISHRPREQRVRQKCPGSEMIAVFGVRQPCCRECSSGNAVSASMACGSHAAANARPAMRSAQVWRAAAMLLHPPSSVHTNNLPAMHHLPRRDCRLWRVAAMLLHAKLALRAFVRQHGCPAAMPTVSDIGADDADVLLGTVDAAAMLR